jgi:hypothetical protein
MEPNTTSSHPSTERIASHTPGPWWVERRVGDALQVNAKHRGEGSSYCVAGINHWEGDADKANAHLIAAAPDLLAALKDLADWLAYGLNKADGAEPTAEDHAACERVAAQARAAVDKAEGRS